MGSICNDWEANSFSCKPHANSVLLHGRFHGVPQMFLVDLVIFYIKPLARLMAKALEKFNAQITRPGQAIQT